LPHTTCSWQRPPTPSAPASRRRTHDQTTPAVYASAKAAPTKWFAQYSVRLAPSKALHTWRFRSRGGRRLASGRFSSRRASVSRDSRQPRATDSATPHRGSVESAAARLRAGGTADEQSEQVRELAAAHLRSHLGPVDGFVEDVRVGIEGDAGARVAEDRADLGDVEPQVDDQVACERISQVVETEPWLSLLVQAGPLGGAGERAPLDVAVAVRVPRPVTKT
jgi:hypothetical protein